MFADKNQTNAAEVSSRIDNPVAVSAEDPGILNTSFTETKEIKHRRASHSRGLSEEEKIEVIQDKVDSYLWKNHPFTNLIAKCASGLGSIGFMAASISGFRTIAEGEFSSTFPFIAAELVLGFACTFAAVGIRGELVEGALKALHIKVPEGAEIE